MLAPVSRSVIRKRARTDGTPPSRAARASRALFARPVPREALVAVLVAGGQLRWVTLPSETNLRVMRAVLEREDVEFLEEDRVRMRKGWR
jgi:hypothetical protein